MGMADGLLTEFKAESDIHGRRINLSWIWTEPGDSPTLQLVRRRRAYPTGPEDGLPVLNLADLFSQSGQTWARIERTLYLDPSTADAGEMRRAEVRYYFKTVDAAEPARVTLSYFEAAANAFQTIDLENISRLKQTETSQPPWDSGQRVEILATPGGGPEVLLGQIVVSTGHQDGQTLDCFEWIAADQPSVSVAFSRMRTVWLDRIFEPDSDLWRHHIRLADMGLEPEVVYYYTLFDLDERTWRASAMATGHYDLADRLYRLLPAIHKQYDEPGPDQSGRGQLRRFLQIFGLTLDHIRSQAEGLRGRHDVLTVDADRLPSLARWIGWELDQTLDEIAQRSEILFAPELYRTVGTIPNLKAMVNHITGWDCQIKEFGHNVCLSNAPETIQLWELWTQSHDGTRLTDPVPIFEHIPPPNQFDGRPAAVIDNQGVARLFWHSNRSGRWQLWGLVGQPADEGFAWGDPFEVPKNSLATNKEPAAVADEAGIWLFWASDQAGSWDIWGRSADGQPQQLTEHPADDHHPAAVRDQSGRIWLFWQSNRRGPTDIWAKIYDPQKQSWSRPMRVTTARFRHEMPAAVVDNEGHIWLFWSTDLGDRRNLYVRIFDGQSSHRPEPITAVQSITEGTQRDEAPTAVLLNGHVWLCWHSNRAGRWQIWTGPMRRTVEGVTGDEPIPLPGQTVADKEPVGLVDGSGQPHLFWRSQRRGRRYQSRTIDVNDKDLSSRMGTFNDRAHYTFDTGQKNDDWYAQGTIGLYLRPDAEDMGLVIRNQAAIESVLKQFLPIQTRVVFIIEQVDTEYVYTYDFPELESRRHIGEQAYDSTIPETYFGPGEAYRDAVPEWIWIHAWSEAHADHRIVALIPPADDSPEAPPVPVNTEYRTWHIGLDQEEDKPWRT